MAEGAATPSAYGGYDASDDDIVDLLEDVPQQSGPRKKQKLPRPSNHSSDHPGFKQDQSLSRKGQCKSASSCSTERGIPALILHRHTGLITNTVIAGAKSHSVPRRTSFAQAQSPLFKLPQEVLDGILGFLEPHSLAMASAVCKGLRESAVSDMHWRRCVQKNVPGIAVTHPGPCKTFRELYAAHDDVWFLPRYKIWFADQDLTGRIIIARYDPRRGCIDGYQLLASSFNATFTHWPANERVIIHGFNAQVKLHLDKPALHFPNQRKDVIHRLSGRTEQPRFKEEIPMTLGAKNTTFTNFAFVKPLDQAEIDRRLELEYPYDHIWPPPAVPARHYVSGAGSGQGMTTPLTLQDQPQSRGQVSDQAFRIHQWVQLGGFPHLGPNTDSAEALELVINRMHGRSAGDSMTIKLGEQIITYSTLDPALYTPTKTKPWRGIWVGDYSGHGCEFLLVNQPDDPPATNEELGIFREKGESDKDWEQKQLDARIYRGRLEAIKLTGDPNVPRGEYTFVADDLGPDGFIGVANDLTFAGSRLVHSRGHVAATGFLRGK